MLGELLSVVKLYVIRRARIIISNDKTKSEWGDVMLDLDLEIKRCNIPLILINM